MTRGKSLGLRHLLVPLGATIAAMSAYQVGAAIAKGLFPTIGPQGAAAMRLVLGAVILLAVARPWRNWPRDAPLGPVIGLGISMAAVILMFFLALQRLPLGIAMALQFLGPLGIALFGSRRATDLIWAALAALGVWCLVSENFGTVTLDPIGVAWALGAGAAWASYILCGRTVRGFSGTATAALGVSIAAVLVLPVGIHHAGSALLTPAIVPMVLLMGVFSAAIPFSLELYAMRHMPARTFAVLMSLEPAFGVVAGLLLLGEHLAITQIAGVAIVIAAAIGATWAGADSAAGKAAADMTPPPG